MAGPVDMVQSPVKSDYYLSGPIAGVIAAQQLADADAAQSRNFRNNDLSYASDLNKYQNAMEDNPVLAMKRKLDMASGQEDLSLHDSGDIMQKKQAELQAQIQEQLSKKTLGEIKDAQARLDWAHSAAQQLDLDPQRAAASEARNKEVYETMILPQAKLVGADKGLPPTWGPQAEQELSRRGKAAENYLPQVRQMALEKQKEDAAMARTKEQGATSRANAQTMAAAAMVKTETTLAPDKAIENKIRQQGYVTPEDERELSTVWEQHIRPNVEKYLDKQKDDDQNMALQATFGTANYTKLMQQHKMPSDTLPAEFARKLYDQRLAVAKKEWISDRTAKLPKVKSDAEGQKKAVTSTKPSAASSATTPPTLKPGSNWKQTEPDGGWTNPAFPGQVRYVPGQERVKGYSPNSVPPMPTGLPKPITNG